jgi:hypothetical protein
MSILSAANPFQNFVKGVGAIAGGIQGISGGSVNTSGIRNWAGGITGGQRSYNIVPTAGAYEGAQMAQQYSPQINQALSGQSTVPTGGSGSGGSSGGGGQVLGQQTQQGGGDPFAGMGEAAKSQAQIELEQALQQYDYLAEQANNQIGQLGTHKRLVP